MAAVVPLKAKPAAAYGEGVGRSAVAFIRTVIGLHVSVRLNLKCAVSGLNEEMFPVPTRGHGECAVLFLGGFLVRFRERLDFHFGHRRGQRQAGVDEVSAVGCWCWGS